MVTGAYYPELAGGSLQCRTLTLALRGRADVRVLTTTSVPEMAGESAVDDVPVVRVLVDPKRLRSKGTAAASLIRQAARLMAGRDIIHFHGITEKVLPLVGIARMSGRRIIAKLTSVGWDDPVALRTRRFGWALATAVRHADRVVANSAAMRDRCLASGLSPADVELIPNGVDTDRFRPSTPVERVALRGALALPPNGVLITFVGFWSIEKGPHLLFEAWRSIHAATRNESTLLFIGTCDRSHPEVDVAMVERIRREIAAAGLERRVLFVDRTPDVAPYLRSADVFALPSAREGLPNALLEAMSSGLPSVVTDLPGVTDYVIDNGADGTIVPRGDVPALGKALADLVDNPARRDEVGGRAREKMLQRFSIESVATRYLRLYTALLEPAKPGAPLG
jgi:glycosyltransferase involved in cell wall biosynthesis